VNYDAEIECAVIDKVSYRKYHCGNLYLEWLVNTSLTINFHCSRLSKYSRFD